MRKSLPALAVLLAFGLTYPALSQNKTAPVKKAGATAKAGTAKKKAPKYEKLLQSVEETYGKPLTDKQKTEIRAAAMARTEAMKPIQDKFRTTVAKSLGLTKEQYEAKIKASHKKDQTKKKA